MQAYFDRLNPPAGGPVDVILDTDTYNEIDDQYALSYLLLSKENYRIRALTAAPFFNDKSSGPADGMERSYQEILKILDLAGKSEYAPLACRGSRSYLPDETSPVPSEACDRIIDLANQTSGGRPLYILALGALTNVASALIKAPDIARRCVLVWLGGNAFDWPDTREFNMKQDIAAARVVFNSEIPLIQLPCMGVVSHLVTTQGELERSIAGTNALCDYLYRITVSEGEKKGLPNWSRILWDVSVVAWLKGEKMMRGRLEYRPLPAYDGYYSIRRQGLPYQYIYCVNRDEIFSDLFGTISAEL